VTGTPGSFLGGGGLSAWQSGAEGSGSSRPDEPCRHAYPIAIRSASLATALGLLMRTLPYTLARLGLLLAFSFATLIWIALTFGIGAWLGAHVANVLGVVWTVGGIVLYGLIWYALLRYALHVLACGHVAILTELILHNRTGPPGEGMVAYGIRVVRGRFAEITVLYGLHAIVRGVVDSFNRTIDFFAELFPIPGVESVMHLVNLVLRASTRYADKAIFSYDIARGDANPWRNSQDGVIYYCQNAKDILKKSLWLVILDKLLIVLLWLLLLGPAVGIALLLPSTLREWGTAAYLLIAALLAWSIHSAFIKPLFMVIILVKYHTLIEGQPINESWDGYLTGVSSQFGTLKQRAQAWTANPSGPAPR